MKSKILIVDDERDVEPLFRQNLRREVRQGRYELEFAFSAEEAIIHLEGDRPPGVIVVLSDVNMPGKSGLDFISEMRPKRPDIKYSMVTAYGDLKTRAKARDIGAEAFFTKPVDFEEVRAFLDKAIAA